MRNIFKFFYLEMEYITLVDNLPLLLSVLQTDLPVTTLAGKKIGAQKVKSNGLLDKLHKFQNLYEVNIYNKARKYTVDNIKWLFICKFIAALDLMW